MNQIIEGAKQVTQEQTRQLDLAMACLPEEKHNWVAGGCAKTPLQIYLECAAVYLFTPSLLQGKTIKWEEASPKVEEYPTFEKAKAFMHSCQDGLLAAIDAVPESKLGEMVELPWHETLSLGQCLYLPSYHTSWHCGQLNYIQTLLGDKEMHF